MKPELTNYYGVAHQGMGVLEMSCGEFCMLCGWTQFLESFNGGHKFLETERKATLNFKANQIIMTTHLA